MCCCLCALSAAMNDIDENGELGHEVSEDQHWDASKVGENFLLVDIIVSILKLFYSCP